MTSLVDKVKQNAKLGSSLVETSREELGTLSSKAGLPTTPPTPLEGAVVGASPDQAKMVGTPAQQGNAVRLAISNSQNLADASRQAQARKTATGQEQAQVDSAGNLITAASPLSRVGELAKKLVANSLPAPTTGSVSATVSTSAIEKALPTTTADKGAASATIKAAMDNLLKGTDPAGSLKIINETLGKTPETALTTEQVKQLLTPDAEQIQKDAAAAIPDTLKLKDLTAAQLQTIGFDSMDNLKEVLGEDVTGLSVGQIKERIADKKTKEFSDTDAIRRQLDDPSTSESERVELRKRLRELGAVGIRSAEAKVDDLQAQVEDGDKVLLDGKKVSIEDFLSDKSLQGMIGNALSDSEYMTNLETDEPELASWIKANQSALKVQQSLVDDSVKNFAKIQETNKKLNTLTDGSKVSDAAMDILFPDWKKFGTGAISAKPPIMELANSNNLNPRQRQSLVTALDTFAKVDPQLLKDFSNMNYEQLVKLGFDQDPAKAAETLTLHNAKADVISSLDPKKDADALINVIFGSPDGIQKAQQELERAMKLSRLSGEPIPQELLALDANRDGKIDDLASIKNAAVSAMGGGKLSLQDMLNKNVKADSLGGNLVDALAAGSKKVSVGNDPVIKKYEALFNDANLSNDETEELIKQGNSAELFKALEKTDAGPSGAGAAVAIDPNARRKLMDAARTKQKEEGDRTLTMAGVSPTLTKNLTPILNLVKGYNLNKDQIKTLVINSQVAKKSLTDVITSLSKLPEDQKSNPSVQGLLKTYQEGLQNLNNKLNSQMAKDMTKVAGTHWSGMTIKKDW